MFPGGIMTCHGYSMYTCHKSREPGSRGGDGTVCGKDSMMPMSWQVTNSCTHVPYREASCEHAKQRAVRLSALPCTKSGTKGSSINRCARAFAHYSRVTAIVTYLYVRFVHSGIHNCCPCQARYLTLLYKAYIYIWIWQISQMQMWEEKKKRWESSDPCEFLCFTIVFFSFVATHLGWEYFRGFMARQMARDSDWASDKVVRGLPMGKSPQRLIPDSGLTFTLVSCILSRRPM
ncbi:hypothetical protein BD289DRAFT_222504 [Coniella lustricola]|uniref:Uncharacterized protein n=1 Tax=Coniella lustricola TaxID=2025994 RepID=A0A2T3AB63_9PEZI|nr:hypothetical protein BD289DRAFT_222504 [Coniella lustricola]